jgi:hypothetical protein
MPKKIVRKSVSFPRELAYVIERLAVREERSFTKQVVNSLRLIFASEGVIHLKPKTHDTHR